MDKVSILGCGWLGVPLAEALIKSGYHIKGSTRSPEKKERLLHQGIQSFLIDIEKDCDSRENTDNLQDFLNTDVLIISMTSKSSEAFKRLLTQIKCSPIKNIIFISTTSVYQMCNQSVSEDSLELNQKSPHLAQEKLLLQSFLEVSSILRPSGLIGPGRHPGRFFSQGKVLQNPDAYVNLVHLQDCIQVIAAILEKQVWGEIFNLSSDHHPTKREFYTRAARVAGFADPICAETDDLGYKIINNEKVKEYLGIDFSHSDLMKPDFFQSC